LLLTLAVLLFAITGCGGSDIGRPAINPSIRYVAVTTQELQDFANNDKEKFNAYLEGELVAVTGKINNMDSGSLLGVNLYGVTLDVPGNVLLPVLCQVDASTYSAIVRDYSRGDEITLCGEVAPLIPLINQTGVLECVVGLPKDGFTVTLDGFMSQVLGGAKEVDVKWIEEARFDISFVESFGIPLTRKSVIGTVQNISSDTFYSVKIEFNLYDSEGARICTTASDTISSLRPGDTWDFTANAVGNTGAASSFAFVRITARAG